MLGPDAPKSYLALLNRSRRSAGHIALRALPLVGLVALGWLGCGDDDKGPSRKELAKTICEKREDCDSDGVDQSDCEEYYEEVQAFDPDYFIAAAECYEDSTCTEIANDGLNCIGDELRQTDPTDAQSDFCEDYAQKANECDNTIDEEDQAEDCEKGFAKLASEDYIDDLSGCLDRACDEVAGCFLEIADNFDVDGSDSSGDVFYPGWIASPPPAGDGDGDGDTAGDGDGDGDTAGDGDGDGDGDSNPDACVDQCVNVTCASEVSACNADAACVTLNDCLLECSAEDDACIDACASASTEAAIDTWLNFADCVETCGC